MEFSVKSVVGLCPPVWEPTAPALVPQSTTSTGNLGSGGVHPTFVASPALGTRPPAPRRLIDAVTDPTVPPILPGTDAVPPEVLARLRSAQRILVVSHVRPPADGDAVGSTLGLGLALRGLGKTVDMCIDGELSGMLRKLDPDHALRQRDEIAASDYDLVVMVDVGQLDRIGGAAELVLDAPAVMVIDHHDNAVTRETLGLRDDVELTTWVQPRCPAAALQISDVVARLEPDLNAAEWRACAMPMAAGILTDTGFFKYDGVHLSHVQRFKGLLQTRIDGDFEFVKSRLKYQLPEVCSSLLAVPPRYHTRLDAADAAHLRERIRAIVGAGVSTPVFVDEPVGGVVLTAELLDLAVAVARLDDPGANRNDVIAQVKYGTLAALKGEHPVAVMLVEEDGDVAVEVRSREAGPALALAEHLGGGGHPAAAGARVEGSLAQARAKIARWAQAWRKARPQ